MTGKTILVTRAKGDEQAITKALQAHGHYVIHEPLTEILLRHTERQAVMAALLQEPDAVIVTSRHGAQALALLSELRDMFILCVGEATQYTAQSLGFTRTASAGGIVERLIEYIAAGYDVGSRFLYISGEHVRADLVAALAACGMEVQRIVAYEAVASRQLSDTLVEQLRRKQVDVVTFLSPRAAQIFMVLLDREHAQDTVAALTASCISEAAAEPLMALAWKAIHIAREATLASLVECVHKLTDDTLYQNNGANDDR